MLNETKQERIHKDYTYSYLIVIDLYIKVYIFTQPSARVGYDTRSIFKRSLTGLNLEFSFSLTSRLAKAEEPSLPYYLSIAGGGNNWIHTFPKGINAMWNTISLVQDLNSCRRVHFLRW